MTLLSAATLAERWDCHRDTIYKKIGAGELPCRRIYGMVRIPLEAVEAIEEGREWRDDQEDTGSSLADPAASGTYAGPRIVGDSPEALAQQMRAQRRNGSPGSSLNSTSPNDRKSQP